VALLHSIGNFASVRVTSMDFQVECPFCGEPGEIDVEVGDDDGEQEFVQDCEVCCHPWSVRVRVDRDGEVSVSVDRSG
jgi:uncharacterized Zn finger protein